MKRRNINCPMMPAQQILLRLGELQTGLSRCGMHWNKLYYIEQIYLPQERNGCRLYYDDGYIEEISAKMEYVLRYLLHTMMLEPEQLQQQSRFLLEGTRSCALPLCLNAYFILIPVICRKKRRESDTEIGYVVLQKIDQLQDAEPNGTVITFFTTTEQVTVHNSRKNMRKQIAQGVTLHQAYVREREKQETLALEGLQAFSTEGKNRMYKKYFWKNRIFSNFRQKKTQNVTKV